MFTLNKPKLALVHEFLLARGLERGEIATSKILQSVYANYLFNVLYPGFPVWRAKEQATKILRETVNKSRKSARPGLAYDQLPTCDVFERLDELIRIEVPPIPYNEEDCDAEWVQTIAVPLNKQILQYAQEHVKEKKKDQRDIRLHLYLWLSNWIAWEPYPTQFSVDSKDQWTETDQKAIEKYGYRHIDITDKVDWNNVLAERKQNGEIVLEFDCDAEIKQLSICTVWQKTPAESLTRLHGYC
ncbi:hypothetical protein BJV82DRAFT_575597 [Fennellomyces sp. T-0311]|nr:hypothetical protein BJV82DRAFT_575597 [Fennellomyces sp. T-0311]